MPPKADPDNAAMRRNVGLYRWFKFAQNLIFWQATWFLFFQDMLTPAKAILIYAAYDISATVLEVPAGYLSDRIGRRPTLILAAFAGTMAAVLQATGDVFAVFLVAQVFLGAHAALASGTDTAFLYESLSADGRAAEMERESLIAWRFGFVGLAISAVTGGVLAFVLPVLPYFASTLAFALMMLIALRFAEPTGRPSRKNTAGEDAAMLVAQFRHPVLIWLLVLGIAMYVFSHIPFIFGQPFILEAVRAIDLAAEAPMISGAVTAIMMVISVLASLVAGRLRHRIGLPAILLLSFGIQIGIILALALSNAAIVIAILFLRMVPNSLSQPFVQARIQPLLASQTRATFLSVESFVGRMIFAVTLFVAAGSASGIDAMPHGEIRVILLAYAAAGGVIFIGLLAAARRVQIEETGVS